QRSEVTAPLPRPMKIRAARSKQTEPDRVARVGKELLGSMAPGDYFQPRSAGIAKCSQQRLLARIVQGVAAGMREHAHAAAPADAAHRLLETRPRLRHVPRLARGQIFSEYGLDVRGVTLLHDVAREMRASYKLGVPCLPAGACERTVYADLFQPGSH